MVGHTEKGMPNLLENPMGTWTGPQTVPDINQPVDVQWTPGESAFLSQGIQSGKNLSCSFDIAVMRVQESSEPLLKFICNKKTFSQTAFDSLKVLGYLSKITKV